MNLRERGVTVGDLLIILIIIISTTFIIDNVKNSDKQSHLYLKTNVISMIMHS